MIAIISIKYEANIRDLIRTQGSFFKGEKSLKVKEEQVSFFFEKGEFPEGLPMRKE